MLGWSKRIHAEAEEHMWCKLSLVLLSEARKGIIPAYVRVRESGFWGKANLVGIRGRLFISFCSCLGSLGACLGSFGCWLGWHPVWNVTRDDELRYGCFKERGCRICYSRTATAGWTSLIDAWCVSAGGLLGWYWGIQFKAMTTRGPINKTFSIPRSDLVSTDYILLRRFAAGTRRFGELLGVFLDTAWASNCVSGRDDSVVPLQAMMIHGI